MDMSTPTRWRAGRRIGPVERWRGSRWRATTSRLVGSLGLAALAAALPDPTSAQSTVTLYGVLDAAVYSKQLAGESRLATVTSGGLTTSQWGFRGNEDLGRGLRALFEVSGFLQVDTGGSGRSAADPAGFWGRTVYVGLASQKMGMVRLGRVAVPGFLSAIGFNAFADSASFNPYLLQTFIASGSQPMLTGNGTLDSAWSNAVAYSSPTLGGLTAQLAAAAGEGGSGGRRLTGGLVYRTGPFSASLNVDRTENASLAVGAPAPPLTTAARPVYTAVEARTVQGAVSYDFDVVKLFVQASRSRFSNATPTTIELDTVGLSALVPVGQGRILAAWARTDQDRTAIAGLRRDTASIGYDHSLSKRTDVYLVGIRDRLTNVRSGTGYAAGIRHRF